MQAIPSIGPRTRVILPRCYAHNLKTPRTILLKNVRYRLFWNQSGTLFCWFKNSNAVKKGCTPIIRRVGWVRSTRFKLPKSEGFNSFFYLFTAGFYFISRYAGRNVTAVVGSTLNFSSTFKGDGCLSLTFGFSTSLNVIAEQDRNRLVEI